jgi:hypothetical protein
MSRDRAWRRHIKEIHTIRRMKLSVKRHYWGFYDANDNRISNPDLKDLINTSTEFVAKTLSTTKYDTKNKVKYSPNRSKEYWRYKGGKGTREYSKKIFIKILKEHDII